jgi:cobalamin biosynthesis Co2+ chelatase CbiK
MAFLGAAALGRRRKYASAPSRPQIEIDVRDALFDMMEAIGTGNIPAYKQIVDVEFPVNLQPRMTKDYRTILKYYAHEMDGSQLQAMTPLQAAVYSGNPEMVKLVLQLDNDIEYYTDSLKHSIIQDKTARGMADVFIAHSTSQEQAAPYRAIKKILLLNGAKPKTITTMTGKKLAFPENKANVNEYKRLSGKTRKVRKTRKTRKNKTRRA